MCNASPPKNDAAERARKEEAQRQQRIAQGRQGIDQGLAGFDDQYYDKFKNDYLDYYNPQVEKQYGDARDKLTLQLASRGQLESTAGSDRLGNLLEGYNQQRTGIANQALDAANGRRAEVENTRQNLYGLNSQAADPAAAAANVAQRLPTLQAQSPYQPLADLFGAFLGQAATGVAAERQGYRGYGTGLFNQGAGGARVIN